MKNKILDFTFLLGLGMIGYGLYLIHVGLVIAFAGLTVAVASYLGSIEHKE